jgi:hypothetical protein
LLMATQPTELEVCKWELDQARQTICRLMSERTNLKEVVCRDLEQKYQRSICERLAAEERLGRAEFDRDRFKVTVEAINAVLARHGNGPAGYAENIDALDEIDALVDEALDPEPEDGGEDYYEDDDGP